MAHALRAQRAPSLARASRTAVTFITLRSFTKPADRNCLLWFAWGCSFISCEHRPECYWNIRPSGKERFDLELGPTYVRKAVAAMKADRNTALIGLIIQDMIHDAVANRCGRISRVAWGS